MYIIFGDVGNTHADNKHSFVEVKGCVPNKTNWLARFSLSLSLSTHLEKYYHWQLTFRDNRNSCGCRPFNHPLLCSEWHVMSSCLHVCVATLVCHFKPQIQQDLAMTSLTLKCSGSQKQRSSFPHSSTPLSVTHTHTHPEHSSWSNYSSGACSPSLVPALSLHHPGPLHLSFY